jgi:hypothetical protein
MEKDIEPTCKTCVFFFSRNMVSGIGVCRRYPPTVVPDDSGNNYAEWPSLSDSQWCGEYKEKQL